MKKSSLVFLWAMAVLFSGCDNEKAGDCFQTAGEQQREVRNTEAFSQITVFEYLNLVIRQGPEFRVEIESGANLLNEISAEVIDGRLVLRNENRCNLFRDYGISTVYVTAPNLTEVRSSTGFLVSSEGSLDYDDLTLISERFIDPEADATDGTFDIEFSGRRLRAVVNGVAYLQLAGTAERFDVTIAAGDSRIEAQNLLAQEVVLNHRGSNDLFVDPVQSITGVIRGYGDVIASRRPPVVEVDEILNGRLRFSSD